MGQLNSHFKYAELHNLVEKTVFLLLFVERMSSFANRLWKCAWNLGQMSVTGHYYPFTHESLRLAEPRYPPTAYSI
jgi:hypothetical protein